MKKILILSLLFVAGNCFTMHAMDVDKKEQKKQERLAKLEASRQKLNEEAQKLAKSSPQQAEKLAKKSLAIKPDDNATGNYILATTTADKEKAKKHLAQAATSSQPHSRSKLAAWSVLNKQNSSSLIAKIITDLKTIINEGNDIQACIDVIQGRIAQFPDKADLIKSATLILMEENISSDEVKKFILEFATTLFPKANQDFSELADQLLKELSTQN